MCLYFWRKREKALSLYRTFSRWNGLCDATITGPRMATDRSEAVGLKRHRRLKDFNSAAPSAQRWALEHASFLRITTLDAASSRQAEFNFYESFLSIPNSFPTGLQHVFSTRIHWYEASSSIPLEERISTHTWCIDDGWNRKEETSYLKFPLCVVHLCVKSVD